VPCVYAILLYQLSTKHKPILAFTIIHEQRTHSASFLLVLTINYLCNPNTGPHGVGEIPPPTSGSMRHDLGALRPATPPTLVGKWGFAGWKTGGVYTHTCKLYHTHDTDCG